MRGILGDFWNAKLFNLERENRRDVLIQIFKSPVLTGDGSKALAKKLEELQTPSHRKPVITNPSGAGTVSSTPTDDKVRKAIVRTITQKSTDPSKNPLRRTVCDQIFFRICREPGL